MILNAILDKFAFKMVGVRGKADPSVSIAIMIIIALRVNFANVEEKSGRNVKSTIIFAIG